MALVLNQDFITLIASRCGNREGNTEFRQKVTNEVNASLAELEIGSPFLPWFLRTATSISLTAGVGDGVAFASATYLREVEEEQPYILYEDVRNHLRKLSIEDIMIKYPDRTTADGRGFPKYYAIDNPVGGYFFGPPPDEAYTFYASYYAKSVTFTDDTDIIANKWVLQAPNVLAFHAGINCARFLLQNGELASEFEKVYARARAELIHAHEALLHVNRDYTDLDPTIGVEDYR